MDFISENGKYLSYVLSVQDIFFTGEKDVYEKSLDLNCNKSINDILRWVKKY